MMMGENVAMPDGYNDNIDWVMDANAELPAELPAPSLWRLIVMPVRPTAVSKGGIVIPEMAQDAEGHLQFVGRVAAMGPCAFRSWKFAAGPVDYLRILSGGRVQDAPKVGDWVAFGRFTGQRMEYRGCRLIEMNDDEILARLTGPEGFRVYV